MLQDLGTNLKSWHLLMKAFDISENDDMYRKLISAYSEKHRAYHTLEHIDACFRHFETVRDLTLYPHEIELAFWFHDAIYAPFSKTNEEDSAALADEFLSRNQVSHDVKSRIYELIILTKEHLAPTSIDQEIMLDIDLSILGAEKYIYEQFESDVRKEYKRVPSFLYKKKRKEVLKSFQRRPRVYHTEYFFEQLESKAKKNLAWAIDAL